MPQVFKSVTNTPSGQEIVVRLEININVTGNGVSVGVASPNSGSACWNDAAEKKMKDLEMEIPDFTSGPTELLNFGMEENQGE